MGSTSCYILYHIWPIVYGTYIAGFLLSHKSLGISNIVYSSKSAQSKRMYISPNNYFRFLLLLFLLFPREASLIYWKRADSPNTVEASTLYSSCSPSIHKGALSRRRVIICTRKEKDEGWGGRIDFGPGGLLFYPNATLRSARFLNRQISPPLVRSNKSNQLYAIIIWKIMNLLLAELWPNISSVTNPFTFSLLRTEKENSLYSKRTDRKDLLIFDGALQKLSS